VEQNWRAQIRASRIWTSRRTDSGDAFLAESLCTLTRSADTAFARRSASPASRQPAAIVIANPRAVRIVVAIVRAWVRLAFSRDTHRDALRCIRREGQSRSFDADVTSVMTMGNRVLLREKISCEETLADCWTVSFYRGEKTAGEEFRLFVWPVSQTEIGLLDYWHVLISSALSTRIDKLSFVLKKLFSVLSA